MRRVGSYEAKTFLPRLLDEVARGEVITITKHGVPVAVLSPVSGPGAWTTESTIKGLRRFRDAHPLGGMTVRELIDEGRR
ncbi:MAG TPA: type II toxin-antitoxin system prevent-host-death family antitoxin [Candidatus Limnocylindrales bacterium]